MLGIFSAKNSKNRNTGYIGNFLMQILNRALSSLTVDGGALQTVYAAYKAENPHRMTAVGILAKGVWKEER